VNANTDTREAFGARLARTVRRTGNAVAVGLDPNLDLVPEQFFGEGSTAAGVERYCLAVLDAIDGLIGVVKLQSAYFEVLGGQGFDAMARVAARATERGMIVIADAKRGDIGPTSTAYAEAFLGPKAFMPCDAMTLSPYLGRDSLEPFFDIAVRNHKGVFVCAQTSNPGARDLQSALVGDKPVYRVVAEHVAASDTASEPNLGIVVGATFPETADALRGLGVRSWFLVPGIGAQGGELASRKRFLRPDGLGALYASSRAIAFPHKFGVAPAWSEDAVRAAALELVNATK
jgi:orotidine-5'-phosphate decarboxylase